MKPNSILLLALAAATLTGLAACEKQVKAPRDLNVCYYVGYPKDGSIKFNVLSRDEPTIEHCAVRLYNARMDLMATRTAGKETVGSYNGVFLFATGRQVSFSKTYNGMAFPLLVKAPDGRLVAPGSVVQEEDTPGAQITVEVPKDLPKMPSEEKK